MITVIPRKITATSVNGVTVANDGSITLPVDSAPTTNSTNLVTSGGVKTELDALSARIGNAENPAQVWTDVSFTIPTSSWSLSNNKYTATVQSSSILATSGVFVNYDDLDNAITPIIAKESTGQVAFTTETIPSGTIMGTFRIIDSINGVVPLTRGGTGIVASTNAELLAGLGAASTSALTTGLASTRAAMGIVEDGNTATHTISKGQYVIWKGVLYTADAAIASGTTLAASGGNKNLTAVPNGGLNAVKASVDSLNSNLNSVSFINNKALSSMVNSITDGDDLNNYTTPGMYYSNNKTVSNAPFASTYFHLMVFGLPGTVIQICCNLGGAPVYVRGIYATTIGTWNKIQWATA